MKTTAKHFVKTFEPRFVDAIRNGEKTQTIRPVPKRKISPGDFLSLRRWSGRPYFSKMDHIGQAVVTAVYDIEISEDAGIAIDRGAINIEYNDFARQEGFRNWADMLEFFDDHYGLPFRGVLIRWELLPKLNP